MTGDDEPTSAVVESNGDELLARSQDSLTAHSRKCVGRWRVSRQWFALSATALLIAVVATCVWWSWSARCQAEAVSALTKLNAKLRYADQLPFAGLSPPARWMNDTLGHDWAASVAQVNLGGQKLRDDDLACLEKLPFVQFVWLQQTGIGNRAMTHLRRCTAMEELYLANTEVTDDGLAELAGMKRLQFLSLAGCAITDAGLAHLRGMSDLRRLDLPDTKVTAAGVAMLQRELPRTKIVYSSGADKALRASWVSDGAAQDREINAPHR